MRSNAQVYGGIAAAVIVMALGGYGLARLIIKPAPPAAEAEKPEEEAATTAMAIKPEAIESAKIGLQTIVGGGLDSEILTQGSVKAAPGGEAVLTARAAGAVIRMNKRVGDSVRAGEALAIVESREAAQIVAERSVAQARATLAQKSLAREKMLFEERVSPRQDYERAQAEAAAASAEARRAQASASAARVTADGRGVAVISPINGRITAISANLGAFVQPETELFRVSDPRLVQVEAAVSGSDAMRIATGDRAIIEMADGRVWNTVVSSVSPSLSVETLAATAVLNVPPGISGLQPGQALRVRLFPRSGTATPNTFVVPAEAVQTVNGRPLVFVRTATGFAARAVTAGQASAGRVEILAGLKAGETIATTNAFLLKAEMAKGEGEEE